MQLISSHFCIVKEFTLLIQSMIRHFIILLFLLTGSFVNGQGWERVYSGGGQDEARSVAVTPDGGYVMSGIYNGLNLLLMKVDVDGNLQWSKFNVLPAPSFGTAIAVGADSTFLISGYVGNGSNRNSVLLKTDFGGNLIWSKNLGVATEDALNDLQLLSDGTAIVTGYVQGTGQLRLLRLDTQEGTILWDKSFGLSDHTEIGHRITVASNGDIVVVGERDKTTKDVYVLRVSLSGDLIWEQTYATSPNSDEIGYGIATAVNGGFVIAGRTFVANQSIVQGLLMKIEENGAATPAWTQFFFPVAQQLNDVTNDGEGGYIVCGKTYEVGGAGVQNETFLARVNSVGTTQWVTLAGKAGLSEGYAVAQAPNGGFVGVGYTQTSSNPLQAPTYAYMVRTDANGTIFTNYLKGAVFYDQNEDCALQPNEPALKNWFIRVSSPDFTRYATTNAAGEYFLMVDTGVYDIKVFTPNKYWATCEASITVPVSNFYDTLTTDIGIVREESCPFNQVDIQTPLLRRCTTNTYTVRYCNSGTVASQNTKVMVEKSADFVVVGASIPYIQQGDSLFFNLGLLNAGDCGSFTVDVFLDCNVSLGTAHCMEAHITPDTFCGVTSNWDGAVIEARARCKEGKVLLSVANKGLNPTENSLEYVIIEDVIVLLTPPNMSSGIIKDLEVAEDTLVFERIANGKTYRLISEQTNGYPGLSIPTAAVEGCKTDTTGTVSAGYFTMFPEDDAEPFQAADCQETYEVTFNPTFLKRGHPKGYKDQHYIRPNTDVDYLIRFVNDGIDTVQEVIIRDTLSPWLDPGSVVAGSASHSYTYSVYGAGIASFTMSNLQLAPGAEGFVRFRVSQKPEVPCSSVIYNSALVQYDFNAPVLTNETYHTVCDTFLESVVQTKEIFIPGADLKVYPNPFVESTVFEVTGIQASTYQLELFDTKGRTIFNHLYNDASFRLHRFQITSGILFYRLVADGRPVASGILLAR
jgi:hypothetical protein